jgi:dienelactone hydrolase
MNDRYVQAARVTLRHSPWLAAVLITACADMGTQPATVAPKWHTVSAPKELTAPGAQWIKVEARDGHRMLAAVFRPQGAGPFPVVVVFHGLSGLQPAQLRLGEELASAGFVAVAGCWQLISSPPAREPNPVCSEAPPQAAWEKDPARNSGKELIAAARSLPGVRPDRVGLYGLSRGGNPALWAGSTGAPVQAIVADAPAHVATRINPPPPSTQTVLSGLSAPTLILHGTEDRAVPAEQSRQYEQAARAMGKPVTALYFEGMGHQVTLMHAGTETPALAEMRRKVEPEARRRAIDFLREHLLKDR